MKYSTYLLPALIIIVVIISFVYMKCSYQKYGYLIKNKIEVIDSLQSNAVDSCKSKCVEKPKLVRLYKQAIIMKKPYYTLANDYYSYGSAFALLLIFTSILGGITAFILVKAGWDNSSLNVKVIFLTFFFLSSLFSLLPTVFKNTENTKQNLERYKKYSEIQYNLLEKIFMCDTNTQTRNDSIFNQYNEAFQREQNFFFDIDITKIPTTEKLEKY